MSCIRPKNIKVEKIFIGDATVNDNGNKSAYLGYDGGKLLVQTPTLTAAFDMSKFGLEKGVMPEFAPGVTEKYSLQLTLPASDKSAQHLASFVKALDKMVIAAGTANSGKWFKTVYQEAVVESFYSSSIAYYKEEGVISDKYPPTFKLNIPIRDGKVAVKCEDENGNPIEVAFPIRKGAKVTAILQYSSVWMVGNKFGLSPRPVLLRVTQPAAGFSALTFQPDSDDEDESGAAANPTANDLIESSEDGEHEADADPDDFPAAPAVPPKPAPAEPQEDEEEDEEEEEVKPPPKVVKRVVKKK